MDIEVICPLCDLRSAVNPRTAREWPECCGQRMERLDKLSRLNVKEGLPANIAKPVLIKAIRDALVHGESHYEGFTLIADPPKMEERDFAKEHEEKQKQAAFLSWSEGTKERDYQSPEERMRQWASVLEAYPLPEPDMDYVKAQEALRRASILEE